MNRFLFEETSKMNSRSLSSSRRIRVDDGQLQLLLLPAGLLHHLLQTDPLGRNAEAENRRTVQRR